MKALILAAGYGKRLQPITNEIPKCMVKVAGISLLENALNCLADIGVTEIGIVVGHMADFIKATIQNEWGKRKIPISYYENAQYMETNNIYSLYKAIDFCTDDMLLLEADLFYKKTLLEPLLTCSSDCPVLVSPFNPKRMDGTVVSLKDGSNSVREIILGKWQTKEFNYSAVKKTVNIYRFSGTFAKKYLSLINWYVNNVGVDSYYEKLLGSMIYLRDFSISAVEVPETTWCEIDNIHDLNYARELFGK